MGVSLKDIFSNDEERLVENKRKKAIRNMIIVGIVIFVLLILTILYKYLSSLAETRRSQITRDIQNIRIAVLACSKSNDEEDYPGYNLSDTPAHVTVNGVTEEFRYDYYLLESGDLRNLNVSLNLPEENYIVNYKTGDVINCNGIKFNNRNYYSIEDILAIENGKTPISDVVTIINSADDLNLIRSNPYGYYRLSSNIDMSAYAGGEGWLPIPEFYGTLDGRGYTISNLYINRPNQNYIGLFGDIKNSASVTNLTMDNVNVVGGQYTGSLAGSCSSNINFINVNNAKVTGYNGFTGGLVGSYSIGTMSYCIVNGNVDGDKNVGGVVGTLYNGIMTRTGVNGSVTGSSTDVGGLIGLARVSDQTYVHESFANVSVNGKTNVGGLLGGIEITSGNVFTVYDSYVIGSIETGENNIGGVLGQIYTAQGTPEIIFENVYADVSIVVKNETSGGFAGLCNITNSISQTVVNCFWKKDLAPGESLNDIGTKSKFTTLAFSDRTPEEMNMMRTYTDWDFGSVWSIEERSDTPVLKWEKNYNMEVEDEK